jgi:hypothetical protein
MCADAFGELIAFWNKGSAGFARLPALKIGVSEEPTPWWIEVYSGRAEAG